MPTREEVLCGTNASAEACAKALGIPCGYLDASAAACAKAEGQPAPTACDESGLGGIINSLYLEGDPLNESLLLDWSDLTGITYTGSGGVFILNYPLAQAVDLSGLTSYASTSMVIKDNPSLTTILLGPFTDTPNLTFSGNALSAETVNSILAFALANGMTSGTIDLSGGTSEAPTGQGILDAAALTTAGVTVTTN